VGEGRENYQTKREETMVGEGGWRLKKEGLFKDKFWRRRASWAGKHGGKNRRERNGREKRAGIG
jgi:hypothetical protein